MQSHSMTSKFCGETAMTRIRVALMSLVLVLVTSPGFAQGTETVVYFHADAIGSTRLVTDASGAVVERYDYLPFGEPWASSGLDTRRFGGKERDTETGLDYFGARYYSSLNGRFTTIDPILDIDSAIVDPQRWNRYAYAYNHPFRFTDPDGRQGLSLGLEADYQAWLRGRISDDEYRARAQEHAKAGGLSLGISAVVGAVIAGGPAAWRAGVGCFLSASCQSTAIESLEQAAGGPPRTVGLGPSGLPFRSGEVIARDFATDAGTISMMAEAVVSGKTLHLKDIAIYPKGAQNLQVGTKAMLELLQTVKADARGLGFTKLRITGLRFSGAKPGKEVDLLFDLTEIK
jgi:RHS repeat-associated protein